MTSNFIVINSILIRASKSLPLVDSQQRGDKASYFLRECLWKLNLSINDILINLEITLPVEWGGSFYKLINNDPQGPNISGIRVFFPFDEFRGHVKRSAYKGKGSILSAISYHLFFSFLLEYLESLAICIFDLSCSEISDFDIQVFCKEDVSWLQISVSHSHFMKIL